MVIPKLLADRYQIVRRVGSGGMADVYLARDQQLQRQVALKILHAQYARDQSFIERFRREARSAAGLQHPNVVSIYDWGREDNYHFMVMEFVEGRSLKDVIAAEAPIEPKQACRIASGVLLALDYAHRSGLVHRDVKPGNILLGPSGDARVTDFGIARASSGDTMTQTGTILGTAYYLSPEQAQGLPVDARSDIYSLGVVLYEMLTARRPFEGDSPVAIAYKHVREPVPPPSKVRPGIPQALQAIVMKALAKRVEDRYQTATEMQRDIAAFLQGKQVRAVTAYQQAAQTVADDTQVITLPAGARRRPATKRPGWALALALFLLTGGLALGAWSLVNLLSTSVGGTTIPTVVGKSPTEAERILRAQGLEPSFQGNEPSEAVAEGLVTRHRPTAKRRVTRGATVKYWVSSGLPFVEVPDVKGKPLAEALRDLQAAGLRLGNRTDVFDPDPSHPADTVLDQNPRARDTVRKDTPIDLTVSKGPETQNVPDVIGRQEADAVAILANQDFKVRRVYDYNDAYPQGVVFDQDPKSGTSWPKNNDVTVYVSKGPRYFSMPNVVGEDEATARAELEGYGLNVSVTYVIGSPSQRGRVVNQNPPAGSTVQAGQNVSLQVGQ